MQRFRTPLRSALLGTTLAAAFISFAGAHEFSAAQKRTLAGGGFHATRTQSAALKGAALPGSKYKVLYNFAGEPDGSGSGAEVTLDSSGNIYGTTDYGGANGYGTLFKLANGKETVVHSFGGSGDGETPDGAVFIESNGNMIGTTTFGGGGGNGGIWQLATDGTYSVLHDFTADEGNLARGKLIQDKDGNFYGTCLFGGSTGDGTVYEYSAAGTLTILHTFGGTDGQYPEHGVVMDKKGNLYGVTAFGGTGDNGSVYEIAKNGTFTSLYSFTGGNDGGFLYGGLAIDKKGNLYGSADDDGTGNAGTVFKMTSKGALTTIYDFTGGADGGNPEGDMLLLGKTLYSAATTGAANGLGGVYSVSLKGKEKVLGEFSDANGNYYSAGVTPSGKILYGTTEYGGSSDNGVVFSVKK
jgi:uncharacterized repeat protein (TIGR03803 family)